MDMNGLEWRFEPSRRLMDCASPDFDLAKASALAEEAAASGDADACYIRGLLLYLGEGGNIVDRSTASELLALAAASGHQPASIVSAEIARNEEAMQERVMRLRLRGEERDTSACSRLF